MPRTRWAVAAALLVVLPGGAALVGGDAAFGKADRVLQDVVDAVPGFPAVRLPDAVGEDDDVVREYSWVYRGVPYAWRVGFRSSDYAEGVAHARVLDPRAYGVYVTTPREDAAVAKVAAGLDALADERGYEGAARANLVLAFVQGLEYVLDGEAYPADDYPKYPIETLVEQGGDCEDTSALYVALARALGVNATLLLLDGHMAAGVSALGARGERHDGYLWAETTKAGYRVGDTPRDFAGATVSALPVVTLPALDVAWTAEPSRWGFVVRVDVWNNGTALARGVTVYAGGATAGSDDWKGAAAVLGDLAPGAHAVRWLWVDLPPERAATLRVVAWGEGVPAVGADVPATRTRGG